MNSMKKSITLGLFLCQLGFMVASDKDITPEGTDNIDSPRISSVGQNKPMTGVSEKLSVDFSCANDAVLHTEQKPMVDVMSVAPENSKANIESYQRELVQTSQESQTFAKKENINQQEIVHAVIEELFKLQKKDKECQSSFDAASVVGAVARLGLVGAISAFLAFEWHVYFQHKSGYTLDEIENILQEFAEVDVLTSVLEFYDEATFLSIDFNNLKEKIENLKDIHAIVDRMLKFDLPKHQESWHACFYSQKIALLRNQALSLHDQFSSAIQKLEIFIQQYYDVWIISHIIKKYEFLFEPTTDKNDFIYKIYTCMHNNNNALAWYKKQAYADLMHIDRIVAFDICTKFHSCVVDKLKFYRYMIQQSVEYLYTLDQYHQEAAKIS